jgi:hypothetical protein
VPALKLALEGDQYLRQVGAVVALAREGRYARNARHIAIARQAILTLLLETESDATDPRIRRTRLPSAAVNRLGAAGLLVVAINELPEPAADLIEQSEQLCLYIARQQRADGSLACVDSTEGQALRDDPEAIQYYPGEALYGLMCSQRYRPAAWKSTLVRRALAFYLPWWRNHRGTTLAAWHLAAYTEAFVLTKEPAYAEAVFEMADWLCGLQYVQLDGAHPLWFGGFAGYTDGKQISAEPEASCGLCIEGLVNACQSARQTGDIARYRRYRESLERGLQFLTTLQYTEANTQHFAEWYRPTLLGGFHATQTNGNLRIDYTQYAVCALVRYLIETAGS